jgi:hypothetical protein
MKFATLEHYYFQRVRPRGQGEHLIIPLKELPSLAYFITTTQIVGTKSYKEK